MNALETTMLATLALATPLAAAVGFIQGAAVRADRERAAGETEVGGSGGDLSAPGPGPSSRFLLGLEVAPRPFDARSEAPAGEGPPPGGRARLLGLAQP